MFGLTWLTPEVLNWILGMAIPFLLAHIYGKVKLPVLPTPGPADPSKPAPAPVFPSGPFPLSPTGPLANHPVLDDILNAVLKSVLAGGTLSVFGAANPAGSPPAAK
jgi:hypothetical protein